MIVSDYYRIRGYRLVCGFQPIVTNRQTGGGAELGERNRTLECLECLQYLADLWALVYPVAPGPCKSQKPLRYKRK